MMSINIYPSNKYSIVDVIDNKEGGIKSMSVGTWFDSLGMQLDKKVVIRVEGKKLAVIYVVRYLERLSKFPRGLSNQRDNDLRFSKRSHKKYVKSIRGVVV